MRKAILATMLMVMMLVTVFGTVASAATINTTDDLAISWLNYQIETFQKKTTLSVEWGINGIATNTSGLFVKVLFNNQEIAQGTTITASGHDTLGTAWTFEELGQFISQPGTYKLRIEFANATDSDASNNYIERDISLDEGFLSNIKNGIYDIAYSINKAVTDLGLGFLKDIPYFPFIVIIVIVVVIYLLYRRFKKKKARPTMPMRRTTSYRESTSIPAYNQRRPPYDDYSDQYY